MLYVISKASYGYGDLWTIRPHIRIRRGKVENVKGFSRQMRYKPGDRVHHKDHYAGGTVIGAQELTAKVRWESGVTIDEPYSNLKKSKRVFVPQSAGRKAYWHKYLEEEVKKSGDATCPYDNLSGVQLRRFKQGAFWVREFRCPHGHVWQRTQ